MLLVLQVHAKEQVTLRNRSCLEDCTSPGTETASRNEPIDLCPQLVTHMVHKALASLLIC